MQNKCCTFAGHSNAPDSVKPELLKTISDLIEKENVTTFYVGSHGNFDGMSAGAVREIKRQYRDKNIKLVLVVPKMNSTITNQRDYYESMYDELIIPAESDAAHYKAMITVRNRWMVDNSDFIITYIRREHGGAFTTYKYTQKKEISVINL